MPSPRGHDAPVSVKTLAGWRRKAMDAAGLRHLRKAGFHCFRRKFASELKDVPLKDLMALGGWMTCPLFAERLRAPMRSDILPWSIFPY